MLEQHLEKLRHFVGVASAGSIRSYAVQHHLSQPSISKCIQILESVMEANLLLRSRDGVRLTQAGKDLLEFSEELLEKAAVVESRIKNQGKLKIRARVTMGAYPSIGVYFLPTFFSYIRKEQSALTIDLVTASSAELEKMLLAGRVDFIVSVNPRSSSELFTQKLYDDTFSLYQRAGASLSAKQPPVFAVVGASDRSGRSIASYLDAEGLGKRVVSIGDFETLKAVVEQGLGMGVLPDQVAKSLLDSGKIERAETPRRLMKFGSHTVCFSCRKHRATDKTLQWIAGQLERMLKTS